MGDELPKRKKGEKKIKLKTEEEATDIGQKKKSEISLK